MTAHTLAHMRLRAQQIVGATAETPAEVVRRLGAVQAQDYLGALWAVGLRTRGGTERLVEQAIAEGQIIRTWPMRGTLHFVAPADVRWMLELLTPRVARGSQSRLRQLGIDEQTIAASAPVVARALEGGRQLTRRALYDALEEAGISAQGQRGIHILGQLAYQRLICFGPRAGKQPTFTLLDEWAPEARSLPRDEALAELALRYFTGHGPATVQDLVWWAGLTVADARAGLAAVAAQLGRKTVDGQEYFFARELVPGDVDCREAFLLPPFDEFLISYRDRSASLDPRFNTRVVPGGNGIFNPIVVIDGRVVGTWKRTFKKRAVQLTFSPFESFSDEQVEAMAAAAERYGAFLGMPVA